MSRIDHYFADEQQIQSKRRPRELSAGLSRNLVPLINAVLTVYFPAVTGVSYSVRLKSKVAPIDPALKEGCAIPPISR